MTYWEQRDKIVQKIQDHELNKVPYGTTGSNAYYDEESGKYYNDSGQELRHPEEYENSIESYFENQDYD